VKKWTQEKLEAPDSSTFELAQKHVFDLMKSDSFRRFAASRTWKINLAMRCTFDCGEIASLNGTL